MRPSGGVIQIAAGKWRGILSAMGIASEYLTGKHTQCPICKAERGDGGKDRFPRYRAHGRGHPRSNRPTSSRNVGRRPRDRRHRAPYSAGAHVQPLDARLPQP